MKRQYRNLLYNRGGAIGLDSAIRSAMLARSPDAYYPFDDATAPYADLGSIGGSASNNGTVPQGVAAPSGVTYPDWSASTAAVSMSDNDAFTIPSTGTALSIMFFYKPFTVSENTYLGSKSSSSTSLREWEIQQTSGNFLSVRSMNTAGDAYQIRRSSAGSFSIGTWHHVGIYFSATLAPNIFIDGVLDNDTNTGPVGTRQTNTVAAVQVGIRYGGLTGNPGGTIAHWGVFNGLFLSAAICQEMIDASVTDGW